MLFSAAQAETAYVCKFVVRGMGGEEVEAVIGLGAQGKAFTYDNKPGSEDLVRVPVKVRADGPDHYIFIYRFDTPNTDGGARGTAQLRVPRVGGKSSISVSWRGYYGNPRGDGTCEMETDVRMPA